MPKITIPEMVNPLGKYWEQPDRSEIRFSFGRAWVSPDAFKKLKQYDCTNPTGCYAGKMWKRVYHVLGKDKKMHRRYLLCWFEDSAEEGYCDIKKIDLMVDEKITTVSTTGKPKEVSNA